MGLRKTRRLQRRRGGGVTTMTRMKAKAASNKKQLKILKARRTELMRVLKIQKKLEDMGGQAEGLTK